MADTGDDTRTLTSKIVSVVVAVLIAVIGLGAWWVWGKNLPLTSAGPSLTGEQGRRPTDPLALADFGGVKQNLERVTTMWGVEGVNTLTDEELAVYDRNRPERVRMGVSTVDGSKATVLLAQTSDPATATSARDDLVELQRLYGFEDTAAPGGVRAGELDEVADAEPGVRAHYVHGDVVVRVEVRGPDEAAVRQTFTQVVAAQHEAMPADD